MADDIKRMDIKEFREVGFLQEANREFFHPLGLALEIEEHADGTMTLGGVWDYRDDPEGMVYAPGVLDPAKVEAVDQERRSHEDARCRLFGSGTAIQPVDWSPPPGDD